MAVAVVIPWRVGCPHRERSLSWLLDRYGAHHPAWTIVVSESNADPWVKARAVTPAVEAVHADTVVVADADVWSDDLAEAVARVEAGHAWAIPHRRVHRLTEDSTTRLLVGEPPHRLKLDEPAYIGVAGGGIVVLPRSTYLAIPLDPRFAGWGQEDQAWGLALHCIHGGPWRGRSPLWHLWHPPQARTNRKVGSATSEALRRRYEAARRDPDRMRALIEEVSCRSPASSSTAAPSATSFAHPR